VVGFAGRPFDHFVEPFASFGVGREFLGGGVVGEGPFEFFAEFGQVLVHEARFLLLVLMRPSRFAATINQSNRAKQRYAGDTKICRWVQCELFLLFDGFREFVLCDELFVTEKSTKTERKKRRPP